MNDLSLTDSEMRVIKFIRFISMMNNAFFSITKECNIKEFNKLLEKMDCSNSAWTNFDNKKVRPLNYAKDFKKLMLSMKIDKDIELRQSTIEKIMRVDHFLNNKDALSECKKIFDFDESVIKSFLKSNITLREIYTLLRIRINHFFAEVDHYYGNLIINDIERFDKNNNKQYYLRNVLFNSIEYCFVFRLTSISLDTVKYLLNSDYALDIFKNLTFINYSKSMMDRVNNYKEIP